MKNWRLSILTCFAVLLLAVSFSMPVKAVDYPMDPITYSFSPGTIQLSANRYIIPYPTASNSSITLWGTHSFYDDSTFTYSYSVNVPFSLTENFYVNESYSIMRFLLSAKFSTSISESEGVDGSLMSSVICDRVVFNLWGQEYSAVVTSSQAGNGKIAVDCIIPLDYNAIRTMSLRLDFTVVLSARNLSSNDFLTSSHMSFTPTHTITIGTESNRFFGYYYSNDASNRLVQDAIKNQTNTLTNGYDNSGLNQSNSNLSGAITDYDSTESQITDSSVANIDGATFISPASNATLLTSVSFCTSWLQSLYVNLGDWSLLVAVSLSLALGLMLIGWFKYR